MVFKQMLELYDILDDINADGRRVEEYLRSIQKDADVEAYPIYGDKGKTDVVKVCVHGSNGKRSGGDAPTLGIIGRLGGLGARPERIGFVSDGDGALTVLTAAAKLLDMQKKGDTLEGDVVLVTHVCADAPTEPHEPVDFMDSPVSMQQCNDEEITEDMDAILTVDTTKGNRVINHKGFAISPTVKEGYILRISEDLLDIVEITTGKAPYVFPITTQDITPYGNDLYHLNSVLQPAVATDVPVVGVAITTETAVPGCGTGATHGADVEMTTRFVIEAAKSYGRKQCRFYDEEEFTRIQKLYGSMKKLQTLGDGRE